MKIQNLLNEDFGTAPAVPKRPVLRLRDLNTLQVRTLLRISKGEVDVDSASDKEYEIISDLHDLGLLDDEYQLSNSGRKAVTVINQQGGSSELVDARRRAEKLKQVDATGGELEVDAPVDDVDGDAPVLDPVDDDEADEFEATIVKGRRPDDEF